jgi:REP-associated tyrosine transposase
MPQSLALVLVHIIFSTKNRMAFLQSAELRSEVHAYSTGTLRGLQCEPLQVGGMEDHVHSLVAFPEPRRSPSWSRSSKPARQ